MRRNEITRFGKGDFTDVVSYQDDFVGETISASADTAPWLFTAANSGTATISDDGPNGLLKIVGGTTTDNSQQNLQLNGESFKLRVGKRVRFQAKNVQADDVSLCGWFIGLSITDTTVFGNDTANASTDAVGFLFDGTDLFAVSTKNAVAGAWATSTTGNKIDTGLGMTDATDLGELAFEYDGGDKIKFYVDGTLVATVTDAASTKTLIPDDEALTPTIVQQNLSAVARTMYVDYINVEQDR